MWTERAAVLKFDEGRSWTQLTELINSEFNLQLKMDTIRGRLRNHLRYKQDDKVITSTISNDTILELLKKERSVDELMEVFNVSKKVLVAYIEDLKDSGYQIVEVNNMVKLDKITNQEENIHNHDWRGETEITFGLISDQHLGSKGCQLTHLDDFYDRCVEHGIKDIYGCGDLVDGVGVYPGQEYGVHTTGMDEQLDFFVKNYPKRDGIITHTITGNHCLKSFSKTGNDIGRAIANERKDINYLGQYYARVNLTPKCILQLCHPLGNTAYSLTYKLQRKMDGMTGGDKASIIAEGHFHSGAYIYRRNIHGIMLPSFQGPNDLSRRLGLESNIGAVIATVKLEKDGTIKEFTPKFINYMKIIENDYKKYI